MQLPIFITGNQNKADYLAKWLGVQLEHQKVDLDEIQSLDVRQVVEHKARQAYEIIKKPVLVEDVSLSFDALGKLPGTYIKWFLQELGAEGCCRLLDNSPNRNARAAVCYGLYDGTDIFFFESSMNGTIADKPRGANGFGWDVIFIYEGQSLTRAEMDETTEMATSMRQPVYKQLCQHLQN